MDYDDKISVMRFYENDWEYVGEPGFSNGYSGDISLSINNNGVPCVSYYETNPSASWYPSVGQIKVKTFLEDTWFDTNPSASWGLPIGNSTSLAINDNNILYVSYFGTNFSEKQVFVKKFEPDAGWTYYLNDIDPVGAYSGYCDYSNPDDCALVSPAPDVSLNIDDQGVVYLSLIHI